MIQRFFNSRYSIYIKKCLIIILHVLFSYFERSYQSLRLSKTALGETTVGQVVNLLSNDVNRFDVAVIFVHYLWIGPLATVIITFFMWKEIDWAAVVGVGFMLAFIPLQGMYAFVFRVSYLLRNKGTFISLIITLLIQNYEIWQLASTVQVK